MESGGSEKGERRSEPWRSTALRPGEMCVRAPSRSRLRAADLTIVDFHQPSRNSQSTAGAVIASAGLRPLVPYTCRRRSGPSQEEVVASPSGGLFCSSEGLPHRAGALDRDFRAPARQQYGGNAKAALESHWFPRASAMPRRDCLRDLGPAGAALRSDEIRARPRSADAGRRVRRRSILSRDAHGPYVHCVGSACRSGQAPTGRAPTGQAARDCVAPGTVGLVRACRFFRSQRRPQHAMIVRP